MGHSVGLSLFIAGHSASYGRPINELGRIQQVLTSYVAMEGASISYTRLLLFIVLIQILLLVCLFSFRSKGSDYIS